MDGFSSNASVNVLFLILTYCRHQKNWIIHSPDPKYFKPFLIALQYATLYQIRRPVLALKLHFLLNNVLFMQAQKSD